jgi:predicted nicotinamide N-methyase
LNRVSGDIEPELTALLSESLPGARIEAQALPLYPSLRLYLLNADYPQHALPPELALRLMDQPLYWTFCWASGQVLARWLLENPAAVRGKRVVDFGCGSGVAGIAAALAGADTVVGCDLDAQALAATAANARLNGVALDLSDDFETIGGDIDVILVADVLYDRGNLPWLSRFNERSPVVLMADSRLPDFEHPDYRLLAESEASTLPDLDESPEFRNVRLYCAGHPQHGTL